MDDEIIRKQEAKEWEDGEYEAFLERFRWFQQHGEPSQSGIDNCFPYREER